MTALLLPPAAQLVVNWQVSGLGLATQSLAVLGAAPPIFHNVPA